MLLQFGFLMLQLENEKTRHSKATETMAPKAGYTELRDIITKVTLLSSYIQMYT